MKIIEQRLIEWFKARGITEKVLENSDIFWTGDCIKIPIKNKDGEIIFHKYRRSPWNDEEPKYWYSAGSFAAIFNIHLIKDNNPIFITEGELDALCLLSKGYIAVSTTGGSGTFHNEWRDEFFGKDVYICYDNDDAGYKGALKVQAIIPWAKIIWLPEMHSGKDITDFFKMGKKGERLEEFNNLIKTAKIYRVPLPLEIIPKTKKAMRKIIQDDEAQAEELKFEERELKGTYNRYRHIEILRLHLLNRIASNKRILKYWGNCKKSELALDRLKKAKEVPIPKFINFDNASNAKCIWHNENTPSMHYYSDQNKVYCFGCSKGGDVIDVIQQLQKVEVSEAINIILLGAASNQ